MNNKLTTPIRDHAISQNPKMVKVTRKDGASHLFPDTREGARQALFFLRGTTPSEPAPKNWQGICRNHGLLDRDLRRDHK